MVSDGFYLLVQFVQIRQRLVGAFPAMGILAAGRRQHVPLQDHLAAEIAPSLYRTRAEMSCWSSGFSRLFPGIAA